MNGVALALTLATLGVDYSFRTTEEGQLEYTIQIEPEFLKSLAEGEEIHSDVPPEAGDVQRICVRIGTAPVKHTAASIQQFKRLLVAAPRFASSDPALASGETLRTILWPARSNPEESFGVGYGWQPDQQGQLAYYMQIDSTTLKTLGPGDEIHAAIEPSAGRVGRFVVAAGNKQLPRVSPPPSEPAPQPQPLAKSRTRFQTGDDAGALPPTNLPPAESFRSEAYTPQPARSPAAATGVVPNYGASMPRYGSDRESSPADLRAPALAPSRGGYASGGTLLEAPRNDYGQPPPQPRTTRPPETYYPPAETAVADLRGGYNSAPQSTTAPGRYDQFRGGAIQPPPDVAPAPSYIQPAGGQQPPYAEPTTRYSPQVAPNDRFATAPQPASTSGGFPPRTTDTSAPASSLSSTSVKNEAWWPWWLIVVFSLFLSIGGNLYLGWTAAEFYSRYRLAVDRLRTAGRA